MSTHPLTATNQTHIGQPCRNFNILGSIPIVDPVDGREKVVLSNFAAGNIGNLILIDPLTGSGETISLPGDDGAWALLNLNNESLLVGTCPRSGYLHRLELATRTWSTPLRCESETYIWNLCQGDDGMVYGGTYPGCLLLRYDPQRHELTNVGRASANLDNLYSRFVYAIPGQILVECWTAGNHLALYDLVTQEMRTFGRPDTKVKAVTAEFICTVTTTAAGEELTFYDAETLAELPAQHAQLPAEPTLPYSGIRHVHELGDGRIFGLRGQEYFIAASDETAPTLHAIPADRPPTRIHTIIVAPDGIVWGSCGFGQTIFSCDPQTGAYWNSNGVCDQGGEVYGMAFTNDRLYLSAYSGGDHVVYDPTQPWDQVNNQNPKTLDSVGPAFIRPEANSVIGPDGNFWTGWMACYGTYGGALSRVDPCTNAVTVWPDLIPGQALISLAADSRYLYFTTGGNGNGLSTKSEPFHFVVWEPAEGMIWRQRFGAEQTLGRVCTAGGRVFVVVDESVQIFDPSTMAWLQTIALTEACTTLLGLPTGDALIFGKEGLWHLDPLSADLTRVMDLPGVVKTAAIAPDGTIYFASGADLYHL